MTYSTNFPFSFATEFLSEFLYYVFITVLLLGQAIRWSILQSYEIQSCFIIAKGKISKVNYSPFGFSLKILGVFKVIALGNT